MSTGSSFVAVTENRLLGTADFSDRLLSHLRGLVQESYEKSFRSGVVYDSPLALISGGNDAISVSGASLATDGEGHLLDVDASGFAAAFKFENVNAVDYEVALRYAEVPEGIQINPRTGQPEWIKYVETIGEEGTPDLVTDNGNGTVTFRVDSVTESGVSNAGRKVRVYKIIPGPNATTEAVALEELTVSWTGSNNEITSAAAFGQTTVSTTAADYVVVLMGPTVKRNLTLYDLDGYVFLGTVTGGGAGNPPSVFDYSDQDVLDMSLADLQDITSRNATSDRLKVDVKSYATDVDDPQIQVRDPSGTPVFTVDGNGNVVISGTTTQQDFVIVNSSETITDNLTAGNDDSADSHVIKGEWTHTNTAGTANYWRIDGDTGRIGVNKLYDAAWRMDIAGNVRINDNLQIESTVPTVYFRETDEAVDAGGLWRIMYAGGDWFLEENTAAAGDFSTRTQWLRAYRSGDELVSYKTIRPGSDDALDLGAPTVQWRHAYIDGTAFIDTLSLDTTDGLGVATTVKPTTDDAYDLGSTGRQWRNAYFDGTAFVDILSLSDAVDEGVASNFYPATDDVYNLGSPTRQWSNIYTVTLNVGSDILPAAHLLYDLGSATREWAEVHTTSIYSVAGIEVYPTSTFNINGYLSLTHAAPRIYWNETGVAVNAGGLWRSVLDAGDWRMEENTAAGGDFTASKYWINMVRAGPSLQFGGDLLPRTADVYDLGSGAARWSLLANHQIDSYYSNTTGGNSLLFLERHSTTHTNTRLRMATYNVSSDATIANGFGQDFVYRINGTDVAYMKVQRQDSDTQCFIDWIVYEDGVGANTAFRILPAGTLYGRTFLPFSDDTYNLGSTGAQWQNLYIDGTAYIDTLSLDTTDGLGVATTIKPTTDGNLAIGSSSRVWQNIYSRTYHCQHTFPAFNWTETDVAVDAGGLWRAALSAGNYILQENTAVGGDFTGVRNWFLCDRALVTAKIQAHFAPYINDTYDLGTNSLQWRSAYINGTAFIDTLSLDNTDGLGVGSHLKPTTDGDKHLGGSNRYWQFGYIESIFTKGDITPAPTLTHDLGSASNRWLGIYGKYLSIDHSSNTADDNGLNVRRHTTTGTNTTYRVANFNVETDGTVANGFGGRIHYLLENGTVANMEWVRDQANDQCDINWKLKSIGDALVSQLSLHYNDYIESRHHHPYTGAQYDLGASGTYWRSVYANTHYIDANYYAAIVSTHPGIVFAANDYLQYNRTYDQYYFLIDSGVQVTIGAGGLVPWSGILNVGRAGAGTSRADTMGVYGKTDLGTTAGDRSKVMHVGGDVGANSMYLSTHLYRFSNGSDWTTAAVRLTWDVDNTTENGGYLEWRGGDMRADMHWRPAQDSTWQLGSSSLYWSVLYTDRIYLDPTWDSRISGGNPRVDYDSGTDAFWYDRTADAYTWRIANVTRFVFDDTNATFSTHIIPNAHNTYALGEDDNRWSIVYGEILSALRSSTGLANTAAIFIHDGLTNTTGEHLVARFDAALTGTPASGFGGYNRYETDGAARAQFHWTQDGADTDQYDIFWKLRNGTSTQTERMRIHWDDYITMLTRLVIDKNYQNNTNLTIDNHSTASFNGTARGIYVDMGTAGAPHGTHNIYGIQTVVYGGGYVAASDTYGVRGTAIRRNATNSDQVFGGFFTGDNQNSGGTTVRTYGVYALGSGSGTTAGSTAHGIWAQAQQGQSCYGVYGHATGTSTTAYGVYGLSNGTSVNSYGMYCSGTGGTSGNWAILAGSGTKAWSNPHPNDPTKSIIYSTVEANRDTALFRGRAQLVNGQATIAFPEHFALTASELPGEDVHVIVTPRSAASKGIAVVSSDNEGFEARELDNGTGTYEFDFVATAARRGYEEQPVIVDSTDMVPGEGNLTDFEGDIQEYFDRLTPGLKRIMRSNGVLDNGDKINKPLFAARKWRTGRIERPGAAE